MPKVLNVGGGACRDLPKQYDGWEQHVLDIDKEVSPDILCDGREMLTLEAGVYDAVYCSHNLEHYYRHDVPKVLAGMLHVLKDEGYAEIYVPNLMAVIEHMVKYNLQPDDLWYRTGEGNPVSFHDVIYGWSHAMNAGNLYFAHHCGWTHPTLRKALFDAGFQCVAMSNDDYNLRAVAYKVKPCPSQ